MQFKVRIVNKAGLDAGDSFNEKDEIGNYTTVFNDMFEANTPKEARKLARAKYPIKNGYRLGFTKKVRS